MFPWTFRHVEGEGAPWAFIAPQIASMLMHVGDANQLDFLIDVGAWVGDDAAEHGLIGLSATCQSRN